MKNLLMALAEKAVNLVWDTYLKAKKNFVNDDVQVVYGEKLRRIKKNCVRW